MSSTHVSGGESLPETSNAAVAALVFEHSQDLLLMTNWASTIVEVNPAWTRLLGWPREALIGRNIYDFVHPDDRDSLRGTGSELRSSGSARRVFRVQGEDGAWRWLDGLSQVISPNRLLAVLRDHSEARALDAERRRAAMQGEMLAEQAGIVTWIIDSESRSVTRARPLDEHYGHGERVNFDLATLSAHMHPDDLSAVLVKLEQAVKDGAGGSNDVRIRGQAPDGWEHFRITYRCERQDERWLVHGLSQNITELVRARDGARAAAEEALGVLEHAPFASCILNPDFEYLSVSGAWKTLFSPFDSFQGRKFASRMRSPVRRRLQRALERALKGEVHTRAEEAFDLDGRAVILRWQARPWRAPSGEVRGVIVYASDITDMVAARRGARASAKRLKLALEGAKASVFEIDYANERFWAGEGFHKLTGRTMTYEEALGPWPSLHPADRAGVVDQISAFDTRRPEPIEARMMTAEGERWTRSHLRIQHDAQGRPRKAVGLIQDIDAHKRQGLALELAERRANVAAEAKSNFLANISHEIRTPMNGVLGVMQLIKREHLDEEERGLLDEALASGRMLTEMLDDLLDFSKIETGQFEIRPEPLDPTAVLVGVSSLLEPVASAKGLKMTAVAAPDVGLVKADPLRLRQALYNIMGNAVKFTPQGSIEARLTRHTAEDGAERLRFEVQDTGVGVPEEFQPTLFERFEQADGSTSRRHGGSGLGLAITKRLAEMMGGAVGFFSIPGQGSTFWIEIDGERVDPADAADAETPDIGHFRVLLVEDNATNRLVISRILEALGVTVDTAADGAEGVELAAVGGYDLVLMDIQMPGMDGLEATRRIRAMDGAVGSTPIVAVTANVLADQRTSYTDAGMDGVVSKPVSAASLLAEIARVTERSVAA